ncbi:MAG: hypothetical protein QOD52_1344 [Gaiellaceae bacterium]|jgi:hypothetical protein|nr:hypothetical protein [Gaiellaceae bacterium]
MSTMATSTTQSASTPAAPPAPSIPPTENEQRDETLLADDVLETVKEIALDELPGGTIVGIEADADGAGYLAHMLNADGTPMTVYVDSSFDFVDLS